MREAYCRNQVLMITEELVCLEYLQTNVIYGLGYVEWMSRCLESW
jgi:hypothetical protein